MVRQGSFSTAQVSRLTGLSVRQLDHWDRQGFVRPSLAHARGYGSARRYSFAAGLLVFMPVSAFFAFNALSFVASALLLSRVRVAERLAVGDDAPRIREGFAALRPQPALAGAITARAAGARAGATERTRRS